MGEDFVVSCTDGRRRGVGTPQRTRRFRKGPRPMRVPRARPRKIGWDGGTFTVKGLVGYVGG